MPEQTEPAIEEDNRYRIAITVVVDQNGVDEGDAYNRAVLNLALNDKTLFTPQYPNHANPEEHAATIVRWEGILAKHLGPAEPVEMQPKPVRGPMNPDES